MNEIKKCPFCGGDAYAETTVCCGSVRTVIGCVHCGVECEKGARIEQEENLVKTMNKTLESVLNIWNRRAQEPQERKKTRFERLLKEEQRADVLVCCLAYRDKHKGKNCDPLICDECEFYNPENAINYLLAPYEESKQ